MRNQIINILIVFFISISILTTDRIFGQSTPQISIPFEIYDNAGGQKILYFGVDQTATDGIDIHLGESDLPPYPPTGAFDGRWLLPQNGFNGSLSSWLDYRNAPGFPYSGTIEHRFRYQCMAGATEMYFKWDLPPQVTGLVQDLLNGTIINVQIEGYGTYKIINFNDIDKLKLFVYYNNAVTDIENEIRIPSEFILEQNYPNPFNPSTKIRFTVPTVITSVAKQSHLITLQVFDVLGNEIATLINEEKHPGIYEVEFNSDYFAKRGLSGISDLASGIYFYQLRVNDFVQTKKMILFK